MKVNLSDAEKFKVMEIALAWAREDSKNRANLDKVLVLAKRYEKRLISVFVRRER
jgi:hypothetical protein